MGLPSVHVLFQIQILSRIFQRKILLQKRCMTHVVFLVIWKAWYMIFLLLFLLAIKNTNVIICWAWSAFSELNKIYSFILFFLDFFKSEILIILFICILSLLIKLRCWRHSVTWTKCHFFGWALKFGTFLVVLLTTFFRSCIFDYNSISSWNINKILRMNHWSLIVKSAFFSLAAHEWINYFKDSSLGLTFLITMLRWC